MGVKFNEFLVSAVDSMSFDEMIAYLNYSKGLDNPELFPNMVKKEIEKRLKSN